MLLIPKASPSNTLVVGARFQRADWGKGLAIRFVSEVSLNFSP